MVYVRGKITKICPYCGKKFFVKHSEKDRRKYCSRECHDKARIKRTPIPCPACGKIRYFRDCEIKQGRKYCSLECRRSAWTKDEIKILIDIYPLAIWNEIFDALSTHSKDVIYCKASELGIKRIAPKAYKPKTGKYSLCKNCNKEIYQPPSREDRIFCSRKCSSEYMVGENAPTWLGGKSFEPYPPTFNERFKRKIRQRDNFTCVICQKRGKHVHHINYIKDDTVPDNCITLCLRCHNKTNFNRDYWQSFFTTLLHGKNDGN